MSFGIRVANIPSKCDRICLFPSSRAPALVVPRVTPPSSGGFLLSSERGCRFGVLFPFSLWAEGSDPRGAAGAGSRNCLSCGALKLKVCIENLWLVTVQPGGITTSRMPLFLLFLGVYFRAAACPAFPAAELVFGFNPVISWKKAPASWFSLTFKVAVLFPSKILWGFF